MVKENSVKRIQTFGIFGFAGVGTTALERESPLIAAHDIHFIPP